MQISHDCVDGLEDENIYEPVCFPIISIYSRVSFEIIKTKFFFQVNIPELSSKGPLWRYFSKINIDTLVEMARRRKESQHNDKDENTTFADIRKRFGQHRKSIKNRVKKLYNRSNSCGEHDKTQSNVNANAIGSKELNGQSRIVLPNNAGYFKDRHLFSNMLKKSQTSLTFDDAARKKIVLSYGNGVKGKSTKNVEVNFRFQFIDRNIDVMLSFLFTFRIMGAIVNSTNESWKIKQSISYEIFKI